MFERKVKDERFFAHLWDSWRPGIEKGRFWTYETTKDFQFLSREEGASKL